MRPGVSDVDVIIQEGTEVAEKQYDQDEIEARKKKYTRGWIVEPPKPNPGISAVEEIERWYAVIGVRGRAA